MVICGISMVTWSFDVTCHIRSALVTLHFTFCILHFRILPTALWAERLPNPVGNWKLEDLCYSNGIMKCFALFVYMNSQV